MVVLCALEAKDKEKWALGPHDPVTNAIERHLKSKLFVQVMVMYCKVANVNALVIN